MASPAKNVPASRTDGHAEPAAGLTLHQLRLAGDQPRLAAWLSANNSGLCYQDCEDIVAVYVESEACRIPEHLPWRVARKFAYLQLQHRAIDEIRHRGGRRESEKESRTQMLSIHAPMGHDEFTLESVIADPRADVLDELTSAHHEATQLLGRALVQLKPAWAEALILTLEHPDAEARELAAEAGVGVNLFNHRVKAARRAMRKAVSRVILGPECETARATLRRRRMLRPVDPASLAFAQVHADDCLACWAWQRPAEAVAALLPLVPAASLAERIAPFAGTGGEAVAAGGAAAATGTTAAGGIAGSLKVAAAICGATATAGVCTAVIEALHDPVPVPPAQVQAEQPASTPAPTETAAPSATTEATVTPSATAAATATPDHEDEIPAPAPEGATEFEPSAPSAPTKPAPAPAGGSEFQP